MIIELQNKIAEYINKTANLKKLAGYKGKILSIFLSCIYVFVCKMNLIQDGIDEVGKTICEYKLEDVK